MKAKVHPAKTIIFPKIGAAIATNKKRMLVRESAFDNNVMGLIPDLDQINEDYLYYWLINFDLVKWSSKAGLPSMKASIVKEELIPLPPLPEQKRIVAILDEAIAATEKAKETAEKNLRNAKELFESYLQNAFDSPQGDYQERTLKEITSILGDGLHGTPKYTESGDYYFINGNNLNKGKIQIKEKTKRVSVEEYEKYKKNLNNRTVLVSINGTLGNVAFYNNEKIILGKSACYFNLLDGIDKNFIKYYFFSPQFYNYAHTVATGATIKNVSLKSMRSYKMKIPSLSEQKRIAGRLDTILNQTDKLQSIYTQKLSLLDELKQSLLKKAFKGEL